MIVAITATGVVLCTIAILFWNQLDAVQKALLISLFKEHFAYFFTAAVLMFTAFGFTLDWFFRSYIIPVNQLADEVDLLQSVNPNLRIQIEGSQTVVNLAESINRLVHQKGESRIKEQDLNVQTLRQAEVEKNILAALLEDLPQGILICNHDGLIVFYNRKIKQLLSPTQSTGDDRTNSLDHWIGLGRSVYPFINQNLLSRALERIGEKLSSSDKVPVERFLLGMPATCMLPAELVPVLDNKHSITGFIILVEDLMIRHQREKEFLMRLQEWRHKLIQSVSAIRATAEVLAELPPDSTPRQADMYKTLVNEASSTANLLKKADWMAELTSAQPWPLTPIDGHEWGRLLQLRTNEVADLIFNLNMENELPSISVDLHHLSITIIFLLQKIKDTFGCDRFDAELFRKGNWIYLDCQWQGDLDFDAFEIWRQEAPDVDNVDFTSSIDEILEMHGARLWVGRRKGERETHGMLLLLPVLGAREEMLAERRATVLPDHRPEFYDFNLFQQEGQRADQDRYLLNELSYTVFDTETTGLNPRGGDEIISIGATRIVNGRLLREEVFDQLIDPRREIPWASVRYHGIHPEMLKGKPYIEEVLPHFYQFAKDTILIGHNVAFDMLMLEQKKSLTNIHFEQPILDTMLLADVVQPAHKDHSLEALGRRLGVPITDRHTALGDAVTTAEVFLKLLPLLAMHGIHTLGQARHASEKSYYARLRY